MRDKLCQASVEQLELTQNLFTVRGFGNTDIQVTAKNILLQICELNDRRIDNRLVRNTERSVPSFLQPSQVLFIRFRDLSFLPSEQ